MENLIAADIVAQKGKSKQAGVIQHNQRTYENLSTLQSMLINKTFTTSAYSTFMIYDPKERLIFKLPYYPDRILHHAIINILEPFFYSFFTADTYSCIKGRGVHAAVRNLQKSLRDKEGTRYCLKLDIKKFYPSVDCKILKQLLRRKLKDQDLLWLLDDIIDSTDGLPIGNYLSQYFANYYLSWFDHWIKQDQKIKYYFRYSDDIVILSDCKNHLHKTLANIKTYLSDHLNLQVKENYQVFPVDARGIDFLGYRFFHSHILLRKRIKKRFVKTLRNTPKPLSVASYLGWAKHCDSKHLIKKLL